MSYAGYELKFGDTVLPKRFILSGSYSATPNQRLDLGSYRDADGVLHREAVEHTATKIVWETPPLYLAQKNELMSIFSAAMIDVKERKVSVEYYDDETDTYKTGTFYMPDIEFKKEWASNDNALYASMRIAIIEY